MGLWLSYIAAQYSPENAFNWCRTSPCRDSVDMQYIIVQKESQNLKNGQLISLYNNIPSSSSVLMTNKPPSGVKKHHESTKSESHQWPKRLSFFLRRLLWLHLWRHLLHLCGCAQSTYKQSVIVTQVCQIKNMVHIHEDRESCQALSIHVDLVLQQMPGSVILQPILHTSTEKSCEDDIFAPLWYW